MLIIEKKEDVQTLRHLGATDQQIIRIFLFEGRLISTIGAIIGVGIGLIICYLQQTFGFITLGDSSGNFVIDSYPVSIHLQDVFLIFITVLIVGYIALWYPVKRLSIRLLN
jgi:lipoprotein-releasing system permease protein